MNISLQYLNRLYNEDGNQSRFSVGSDSTYVMGRGVVVVMLFDHFHNRPHVGTAVCHPGDRYSRQAGEHLALQRAFDDWTFSNQDCIIRAALGLDIGIMEAKKLLWKTLGANVYATAKRKEITDGNTEPAGL